MIDQVLAILIVYVLATGSTAMLIIASIEANNWYREYRYHKGLQARLKEIQAKSKARAEESYVRLTVPLIRRERT